MFEERHHNFCILPSYVYWIICLLGWTLVRSILLRWSYLLSLSVIRVFCPGLWCSSYPSYKFSRYGIQIYLELSCWLVLKIRHPNVTKVIHRIQIGVSCSLCFKIQWIFLKESSFWFLCNCVPSSWNNVILYFKFASYHNFYMTT